MDCKMKIPKEIAEQICEMMDVCYSEGELPECRDLTLYIKDAYPELVMTFSHLPWDYYE